jgi:hypothetical protein
MPPHYGRTRNPGLQAARALIRLRSSLLAAVEHRGDEIVPSALFLCAFPLRCARQHRGHMLFKIEMYDMLAKLCTTSSKNLNEAV